METYPTNSGSTEQPPPWRYLGDYRLWEPIGKGGQGKIYRGRKRGDGAWVAVKLWKEADTCQRLLQEINTLRSVKHPNCVEYIDAGEDNGDHYLVMEFVYGVNLEELVKQKKFLPIDDVREVVRQTAKGLQHLNENGLIHRDIKPLNLMRTEGKDSKERKIKIVDFGLARQTSDAEGRPTNDYTIIGSPDYMAPEQWEGLIHADIRSDLYSLGCTLYHLLAGDPPFADSPNGKLHAHIHETPKDLHALRSEVPAELAELADWLMAKKPEDRPQTPAEVIDALDGKRSIPKTRTAVDSDSIAFVDTVRKRPRWRGLAMTNTAVGVLSVVATIYGIWKMTHPDIPIPPPLPPPKVTQLKVGHIAVRDGKPISHTYLKNEALHLGDHLSRVEVEFDASAYAYLITYRPDGQEELCWPNGEDEVPAAGESVCFPSADKPNVEYGLTDGTGWQAFVVIASHKPLPPYRDWLQSHGKPNWTATTVHGNEQLWCDRGAGLQPSLDEMSLILKKTKDVFAPPVTPAPLPLTQLDQWWRKNGAETLAMIGFPVLPAESKREGK